MRIWTPIWNSVRTSTVPASKRAFQRSLGSEKNGPARRQKRRSKLVLTGVIGCGAGEGTEGTGFSAIWYPVDSFASITPDGGVAFDLRASTAAFRRICFVNA